MSALNTITDALAILLPSFNKSDGTIESKIIDVVGTYADTEIIERSNTVAVIQDALARQRITNKDYFRRKAVMFQIGDILSYDPINQTAYYENVNEENQIVKQAYIIGSHPDFTLLVNTIGSDRHLRVLTPVELDSFRTYFSAFQPLGMSININSLDVAKISDDNLVIYVRVGTDAGDAVEKITENLIAYEATLRDNNTVSLSEIEDVIQKYPMVRAVGWGNPKAVEEQINGSYRTSYPQQGIFTLTNGAFTFSTVITTANIKIIQ